MIAEAKNALCVKLSDYAQTHGGRYLLCDPENKAGLDVFGDVYLLIAFPADKAGDAWNFAE
jgi:hypothetical protein